DSFLRDDSIWRIGAIYDPFLASLSLPRTGIAVDVGAGFGAFSIPFAMAFPGWEVWCFEPLDFAFSALARNIRDLGLRNVIAVNAAVGHDDQGPSAKMARSIEAKDPVAIRGSASDISFLHHRKKKGYIEARGARVAKRGFRSASFPQIPARALPLMRPDLLKFTAPGNETAILQGVADTHVSHVLGESWTVIDSRHAHGTRNRSCKVYIPLAGTPLRLQRRDDPECREHGLDIVLAHQSDSTRTAAKIRHLLTNETGNVRVICVVEQTTGEADEIDATFAADPRVIVHAKRPGNRGSAFNSARMRSNRTHIAFLEDTDIPAPGFFSDLLELARYSGAQVVLGGLKGAPGRRDALLPFGDMRYLAMPGKSLVADTTMDATLIRHGVLRRDYLDGRNIWFPEHVASFSAQFFQILAFQHAGEIPCMKHLCRHEHEPSIGLKPPNGPALFSSLDIFRMLLKRGMQEGWNDFKPLRRAYCATVASVPEELPEGLRQAYADGAAELWVLLEMALGDESGEIPNDICALPGFEKRVSDLRDRLGKLPANFAWSYLDAIHFHPDTRPEGCLKLDLDAEPL
ncbi:MAG: FkbM family methyltransferase, partial [Paracoccaceae bacterium]